MAGAYLGQGVVGFSDIPENSMVRSAPRPSAPSYSYSSPAGSGSVSPYGAGSVNAQISGAGGAGNFQPSDYTKLVNDAYDMQTKQALQGVDKSWGINIGNTGYLPSDPKAKGLQAELIGAAMAPIMAQRSMALINAERANQDDRLSMARLQAQQAQANMSAIANGSLPGSITQHNGEAGSVTNYSPGAPTGGSYTKSAGYNSEQEGYDRMMAMAAMMQAGGGGGGGQAQAPQGIPGLTPGVGGISSMIGSANPNTSGFGQKGPSAAQESILAQTRNTPPAPNYKPLPTGSAYSAFSNSGNGMSLAGGMGASLNSTISNMVPSATAGGGAYTPSNTTKAAMAGAGLINGGMVNKSPLLKPGGAPPGY